MLLKAAARKLSIPELFRILDEKLVEECSKPISSELSAASIESQVRSDYLARGVYPAAQSDSGSLD